jgi:hypothetical protein
MFKHFLIYENTVLAREQSILEQVLPPSLSQATLTPLGEGRDLPALPLGPLGEGSGVRAIGVSALSR